VTSRLNRAGVRRLVSLYADATRAALRSTLVKPELAGEGSEARFAEYLLDGCGRPIVADERWLEQCLLVRAIGAGCAVPVGDDIAAIVAAPRWVAGDRLAEGLLAASRKKELPFLPGCVGLVCGRASAAERDVVENARRRWPAVEFRIENVAVQGPYAVTEVINAIKIN